MIGRSEFSVSTQIRLVRLCRFEYVFDVSTLSFLTLPLTSVVIERVLCASKVLTERGKVSAEVDFCVISLFRISSFRIFVLFLRRFFE